LAQKLDLYVEKPKNSPLCESTGSLPFSPNSGSTREKLWRTVKL